MRVLALDPGEKVGWARADVADDGTWSNLRHGITPLRDMAIAVHDALDPAGWADMEDERPFWCKPIPAYDLVICEDWRLYPHKAKEFTGSALRSVRFIGAVELSCWVSGTKLVMQGARIKKPALAIMAKLDPDLHELCTRPGAHDDRHDQDAILHLFHWCFKTCPEFRGSGSPKKEAA